MSWRLADLLGISYDALRMKLNRGDTIEHILAEHLKVEKPVANTKSLAAKIEACPWPEGKEEHWEKAFQAERCKLLDPHDQDSRTAFFVAKCRQKFSALNDSGREYAERYGPDVIMPAEWVKQHEYWRQLLRYALEQREVVLAEKKSRTQYSLGPSVEGLAMIEQYKGGSSANTEPEQLRWI